MGRLTRVTRRTINHFGFDLIRLPREMDAAHSSRGQDTSVSKTRTLDLSKAELIRTTAVDELRDVAIVESLLLQMGLNDENLSEFPLELLPYTGYGLFSWQYPNQFSRFLVELSKYSINSYLEIGVRHGGTFVIVYEYLKRFNPRFRSAIAVDIVKSDALEQFAASNTAVEYFACDSHSAEFRRQMEGREVDLTLIDGDHSLEACKSDFEFMRNRARMLVFHDIASIACPGVCAVWQHLRSTYSDQYEFVEFLQQYNEVHQRTGASYLGIGLAIRKT